MLKMKQIEWLQQPKFATTKNVRNHVRKILDKTAKPTGLSTSFGCSIELYSSTPEFDKQGRIQ